MHIRLVEQNTLERFNLLNYPICFEHPHLLDNISAWVEHIPFGMFIIDFLRPNVFVELGTHTGVSYSGKVIFEGNVTPCLPLDVQYVDQFCYSDMVVDYYRNHWSVSPECALMEAQDDYFVNLFTSLYKTLPRLLI